MEQRRKRASAKVSSKQKMRALEMSITKNIKKRNSSPPPAPPLEDNRKENRGKEAQMRLVVWRSAMQCAKVLYGVNKVGDETESVDIGYAGPR